MQPLRLSDLSALDNSALLEQLDVHRNPDCHYRCLDCDHLQPMADSFLCERCGGVTECNYTQDLGEFSGTSIWRFQLNLPVSAGEWFPCEESEMREVPGPGGKASAFLKLESTLPIGNTKYRQACVAVPGLLTLGVNAFTVVSTGNTASSYLYWAKQLQGAINVYAFAPKTHSHRLRYTDGNANGHIKATDVDFVETGNVAKKFSVQNKVFFESGFMNPLRREGLKTAYLEGAIQMDFDVDYVFQSVSSGMGILGAHHAFRTLMKAGLMRKMPRIICVQQDTCCPMIKAFERGQRHISEDLILRNPTGLASAILRGNPNKSYPYLLRIVEDTGGAFIAVTQQEIVDAYEYLQAENVPACHTACAAYAAWHKMLREAQIEPEHRCMVNITGGGEYPVN